MHDRDGLGEGAARGTAAGLAAIVVWSTSVAFVRTLSETLGCFNAGALAYLAGGLLGLALQRRLAGRGKVRARLDPRYLYGCGGLFVLYMFCFYASLGLAGDRRQAIELGLVNYLWPSFTLALSIPLLRRRARPWFWAGLFTAAAGVVVAAAGKDGLSWARFADNLGGNPAAYALALTGAACWALYSNLARRWGGGGNGVPLFTLAAGVGMALLCLCFPRRPVWSARAVLELGYMVVFITVAGYMLWDQAMRRGDHALVTTCSYAIPLLSTLLGCLYLRTPLGWDLLAGAGLVVAGAALCRRSLLPAG